MEPVEPIEIEFEVACSPEHAFDTWANKTSAWWPRSHSMTSAPGLVVTFEPRPGGRATEVDISFAGDAAATTVTIVHRGWERLGADAPTWRERNLGGWSGLLPHYRQTASY